MTSRAEPIGDLLARAPELPTLLQRAVEEAAGVLRSDGAILYLLDRESGTLRWAHDAGISDEAGREWVRSLVVPLGIGMFGRAVGEGRPLVTGDYGADQRFTHAPGPDRVVAEVGIRSFVVAPMLGADGPLGGLGAFSRAIDAFSEADVALIRALADHAALSVDNARLIEQLASAQAELERRIERQRALSAIAARITVIRDRSEVLQRVVDETKRLLRSDGAHLTLLADEGRFLVPAVVADDTDPATRAWLGRMQFPLGGGINGLAASTGGPVWTEDYTLDPRIPHEPDDQRVARRLGLGAMAAAPMRSADGAVFGTVAVSYERPRPVADEEVDVLQRFADQAAVAVANARLYERLRVSESRHRYLLQHSPDLAWSTDADLRLTFVSETSERLTGWSPERLVGQPFLTLVDDGSRAEVEALFVGLVQEPERERRLALSICHRDGRAIAGELRAVGIVRDGGFAGAHGSVRDVSERDRLERDLRRQAAELATRQERAHLARELHDSVTQALFGMSLASRTAELQLGRDPETARATIAELHGLQRDALAEMRGIIFDLRPGSLQEDGLVQALRTHAAAVQGRSGLSVAVDAEGVPRLPLPVEDTLYRIAQDALHDMVARSGSQEARIRLRVVDGRATLSIEDGADRDGAAAAGPPDEVLAEMRDRAERVGGTVRVASDGRGSRLEVETPFAAAPGAIASAE
jgi:PAS domain S-box-containing protein